MVKVISLSNEAYERLKNLKREKSFSGIVLELVKNKSEKRDLSRFFGVFRENADEWEKIKRGIYEDRKKFRLREVKL